MRIVTDSFRIRFFAYDRDANIRETLLIRKICLLGIFNLGRALF